MCVCVCVCSLWVTTLETSPCVLVLLLASVLFFLSELSVHMLLQLRMKHGAVTLQFSENIIYFLHSGFL